jgi:hypothetical protein
MTKRQLRIDTGAVFWRLALGFFVLREAYVWLVWLRRLRGRNGMRLLIFLFHKWATPHSVVYALVFATVATGFLYLLVRFVIGPLVRHWHTPWADESAGLFHVAANERVLVSSPARRKHGRFWLPGALVRTNLRLWFFPSAHDVEIWVRPLPALRNIHLEPAPRVAWGCVRGWPERLALDASAAGGNGNGDGYSDGGHETFAVADPEAVLAWFETSTPAAVPSVGNAGGAALIESLEVLHACEPHGRDHRFPRGSER